MQKTEPQESMVGRSDCHAVRTISRECEGTPGAGPGEGGKLFHVTDGWGDTGAQGSRLSPCSFDNDSHSYLKAADFY